MPRLFCALQAAALFGLASALCSSVQFVQLPTTQVDAQKSSQVGGRFPLEHDDAYRRSSRHMLDRLVGILSGYSTNIGGTDRSQMTHVPSWQAKLESRRSGWVLSREGVNTSRLGAGPPVNLPYLQARNLDCWEYYTDNWNSSLTYIPPPCPRSQASNV
ncbi:uncharacterized protein BCR38DRAFT_478937 [Pseudomassariella vexata]|uniref:Uncharacterized protein n=1 Tax=Pseudomassariella vexata TaxID=1141098 RepID=A0A1Y2D9A5_9PEZI|nr:uncharacterized protein BCR38DRAFT_478937 [Pseudomassariella vexata]ORY55828.1 hypothetical protein BCR38DRAFT_478937 [Pseudomassariella vexata]